MGMEFGGSRAIDAPTRRPVDAPSELPPFRLPPRVDGWERLHLVATEEGTSLPENQHDLLTRVMAREREVVRDFPEAHRIMTGGTERWADGGGFGKEIAETLGVLRTVATDRSGTMYGAQAELAHGRLTDVFAFLWRDDAPAVRQTGRAWMARAERSATEVGNRVGSRDILGLASQVRAAAAQERALSARHAPSRTAEIGGL